MRQHRYFSRGDRVVFRVEKCTAHPGQHARNIMPELRGEGYRYCVDKFWVVENVLPSGQVLIRTRRGKQRLVDAVNPQFRHATWWERLRYADRFPRLDEAAVAGGPTHHPTSTA